MMFKLTKRRALLFAGVFALMAGTVQLFLSFAASPSANIELEAASLEQCATMVTDNGASDGKAIQFGGASCTTTDPQTAGASLPITYSLNSLPGTVRYVATNGSDSNTGSSASSPVATLSRAISLSAAGDSIVVRGGVYRNQSNITISDTKRGLRIVAYPGETPVFNGAQTISGGWTTEGSLAYIAYTPRPVTDGHGISFSTGGNLTGDGVGKFPDQAWIGTSQLQQVSAKGSVDREGRFWVDSANKRLYMRSSDAAKAGIEVSGSPSGRMRFLNISAADTVIEGLVMTRYSVTADDYGVILYNGTADNSVLRNVEISNYAFVGVVYANAGSNFNTGSLIQKTTVTNSAWMGVNPSYTDNLTLDSVKITDMNYFSEFTTSPQSGAFKTSRTKGTKVLNSYIANNKSHGIWFDQSNSQVVVANTKILDNTGTGLFFEISDGLLLINSFVRATGSGQPVKLAGSSGIKLVNNTVVGGANPIGIYTDSRSKSGCADPSKPLCDSGYGSDRDTIRPYVQTMDWMPRVDLMINNIVAYPNSTLYCGAPTPVCVLLTNSAASTSLSAIFHQANSPHTGLPKTVVNGNVYANGTGRVFSTNTGVSHTTLSSYAAAMSASPVSLAGFEASGLQGNNYVNSDGTPTAELSGRNSSAVAIPTDSAINQYMPAGTKRYGSTLKP